MNSTADPDAIRQELDRVLASRLFSSTGRLSGFLRYVVEESLRGRGDQIKEYAIGISVYGKPVDYDPKTDAVVRGDAIRLRTRLRDYYETEGRDDPIRIDVPKGSYVPTFEARPAERAEPGSGSPSVKIPPAFHWRTLILVLGAIFLVTGAYLARSRWTKTPMTAVVVPSIAVLPFGSQSANPEDEHLADGLTGAIIDSLARLRGVQVFARGSVFQFKGKSRNLQEISRRLNPAVVLDADLSRSPTGLEIAVRLTNVANGRQLWSHLYKDVKDTWAVEQDISRETLARIPGLHTINFALRPAVVAPESHDLYIRGIGILSRLTGPEIRKAHQYFQEAVAKDPDYAPAYAGLGLSLYLLGPQMRAIPHEDGLLRAKQALNRALELDETLAAAHVNLARIKADCEWDFRGAEAEFLRAIELSPGAELPRRRYAQFIAKLGRFDESIQQLQLAIRLDPLSEVRTALAEVLIWARRYDEAMQQGRATLELHPNDWPSHHVLGRALVARGEYQAGVEAFQRASSVSGVPFTRDLAYAHAVAGNRAEAEVHLKTLQLRAQKGSVRPMSLALVYAGMGETGLALEYLEKGFAQRDSELLHIKVDSRFDFLRSHPRFQELLRRIGLN